MNLTKQYEKIAKEFIKPYTKDSNIVGITLNGGVSRGTGDIFSEIDIYFYVKEKNKSKLPPKIKGVGSDIAVNDVWFEFKELELQKEMKREWSLIDRWDVGYGKILFQKNRAMTKLKKKKVRFGKGEKKKLFAEYAFGANWSIQLAEVFEKRGDLKHAHLLINNALDNTINYYFLLNNEFIPYFKWKNYYFSKLKKPSKKIKELIFDLYQIKKYSKKELYHRIHKYNSEIFIKDLKMTTDRPHKQNIHKVQGFIDSLKGGITYSNPFED